MSEAGDQLGDVLQMAAQVRQHGHIHDGQAQGAGGRERQLKKMYAEERLKTEILSEALTKSGEAIPQV